MYEDVPHVPVVPLAPTMPEMVQLLEEPVPLAVMPPAPVVEFVAHS